MVLGNHEFDRRADRLIDAWPTNIFDGAREPELYRFVVQVVTEHDADPFMDAPADFRSVLKGGYWFNRQNLKPELPEDTVDAVVLRAWSDAKAQQVQLKPAPGQPSGPHLAGGKRASIRFDPAKLTAAADEAERAMLNDMGGERVFNHGGSYAVVRRSTAASLREFQTGETGAAIVHLDEAAMRERLMASADFYTWRTKGKGEWQNDKAPDDLVRTLRSRRGGNAPALIGLLRAPTICPDGQVIDRPGYHCATGLFSVFAEGEFPALRDRADPADAKAAYDWLAQWLGEFTFRERLDESAAIGALITGLVRKTCGLAPGFMPSSPVQSTGKTTLMLVIGAAVEGSAPALIDWPADDEAEMRKVITTVLMSGRSILAFDNLANGAVVRSRQIARLLSAEVWGDRILAKNTEAVCSTAVLTMLTGNNPVLEGDMPSRVVEIYLDAQTERPEDRVFSRDILAWTIAHRGEIVEKALTIVKAYLDAGAPPVGAPATRFPTWDVMVRRAIVWAGGEDLAGKFLAASAMDPTTAQLRDVLQAWRDALGDAPLPVGDITIKLGTGEFGQDGGKFRDALMSLVGQRHGARPDARAIGLRLKQFANRVVDGLTLVSNYDAHRKQHAWCVIEKACG